MYSITSITKSPLGPVKTLSLRNNKEMNLRHFPSPQEFLNCIGSRANLITMTPDVFVKLLFGRKEATYSAPVKVGGIQLLQLCSMRQY